MFVSPSYQYIFFYVLLMFTTTELQMNTANAIKKELEMRIAHLECSNRKLQENLKECNAKNEVMTNQKENLKVRFY